MPKIIVVLAVTFSLLGAASPASAGPGGSERGPASHYRVNPAIPLIQSFEAPPGTAGTAIVSCDARHQFSYRGTGYPYRAADPSISGDTTVVTGGPYPYRASAVSTGQVGGYEDAYYWRINNTTGVPAALVMSITCQRPDGF